MRLLPIRDSVAYSAGGCRQPSGKRVATPHGCVRACAGVGRPVHLSERRARLAPRSQEVDRGEEPRSPEGVLGRGTRARAPKSALKAWFGREPVPLWDRSGTSPRFSCSRAGDHMGPTRTARHLTRPQRAPHARTHGPLHIDGVTFHAAFNEFGATRPPLRAVDGRVRPVVAPRSRPDAPIRGGGDAIWHARHWPGPRSASQEKRRGAGFFPVPSDGLDALVSMVPFLHAVGGGVVASPTARNPRSRCGPRSPLGPPPPAWASRCRASPPAAAPQGSAASP